MLGIGTIVISIAIWSLWFAPKASQRLGSGLGISLSLGLFLLAALALYHVHKLTLAIIFVVLAIVNRGLAWLWQQW